MTRHWDGFRFANGSAPRRGRPVRRYAWNWPRHIESVLRNLYFAASIVSPEATATDAAVYWSTGAGDDHLVDGLTVDGAGGLALQSSSYHSETGYPERVQRHCSQHERDRQ